MHLKGETGKDLSTRIMEAAHDNAHVLPDTEQAKAGVPVRNIGADFLGSVGGGGLLGALLDYAFGTSPWCLLGFILLGFIVAIVGAWRAMQNGG